MPAKCIMKFLRLETVRIRVQSKAQVGHESFFCGFVPDDLLGYGNAFENRQITDVITIIGI